jgi:D-alanyl-D-alanine carboxypeptidase
MRTLSALISAVALALALAAPALAAPLSPQQQHDIDASIAEWLAQTGAPSVSIAVVNGGETAYVKAYGKARLSRPPDTPSTACPRNSPPPPS